MTLESSALGHDLVFVFLHALRIKKSGLPLVCVSFSHSHGGGKRTLPITGPKCLDTKSTPLMHACA